MAVRSASEPGNAQEPDRDSGACARPWRACSGHGSTRRVDARCRVASAAKLCAHTAVRETENSANGTGHTLYVYTAVRVLCGCCATARASSLLRWAVNKNRALSSAAAARGFGTPQALEQLSKPVQFGLQMLAKRNCTPPRLVPSWRADASLKCQPSLAISGDKCQLCDTPHQNEPSSEPTHSQKIVLAA